MIENAVGKGGVTILDKKDLLEFAEKIIDHITVIEGFLQLNKEKSLMEREIKELKATILNFVDQLT